MHLKIDDLGDDEFRWYILKSVLETQGTQVTT